MAGKFKIAKINPGERQKALIGAYIQRGLEDSKKLKPMKGIIRALYFCLAISIINLGMNILEVYCKHKAEIDEWAVRFWYGP